MNFVGGGHIQSITEDVGHHVHPHASENRPWVSLHLQDSVEYMLPSRGDEAKPGVPSADADGRILPDTGIRALCL